MREEYSPYKIVHHGKWVKDSRNEKQPYPIHVQMVISDFCNHNCSFCAYRLDGYSSNELFGQNPKRFIPKEKAFEILDDCKKMGVKAIQFTGGGEPTCHPDHNEIFKYALDLGLNISLVSNGFILKDETIEILMKASWVRFSMDSSNKETYSRIRKVSINSFERFKKNVKKFVAKRNQLLSDTIVGIGYVVCPENSKEVLKGITIAEQLKVDNIRISAAFTNEGSVLHEKYYNEVKDQIKWGKQFENDDFKIFDLFGDRIDDLEENSPNYKKCPLINAVTYIGADLNVYKCCVYAYNNKGIIGNLKDHNFKYLWESQEKEKMFKLHDARNCERCMFNKKNDFLNYIITNNPKHKDFV